MELPSYSSIFALYHKAAQPLFEYDDVIVEEKIDGSQFTFGLINGELHIRSKGAIMNVEAPMKMFSLAAQTVKDIADKLTEGLIYRAEYLSKPKHNINRYGRIPVGGLIIFDIHDYSGTYLCPEGKAESAARIGLEVVPHLYRGRLDPEVLNSFLDRDSCLGGVKIEGVVVKPARYDLYGTDKKVLMGKLVSADFKERHKLEWGVNNPNQAGIVTAIATALKTDARWNKSIQHLRDAGQLTDSPKDIGPLMRELKDDLLKEEYDEVGRRLVKHFWDEIVRGATRGFPEFYKALLTANSPLGEGSVVQAEEPVDINSTPAWRLNRD